MEKLEKIDVGSLETKVDEGADGALSEVIAEIEKIAMRNSEIIADLKNGPDHSLASSTNISLLVKEAENDYKEAISRLEYRLKRHQIRPEELTALENLRSRLMSSLDGLSNKVPLNHRTFSEFMTARGGFSSHEGKILLKLGEMDVLPLNQLDNEGRLATREYLRGVLNDDPSAKVTIPLLIVGGVLVTGGTGVVIGMAIGAEAGAAMAVMGGSIYTCGSFGVLENGGGDFEDVVGEKDEITGIKYSEGSTFELMSGIAEGIALDSKDWRVKKDGSVLKDVNDYLKYLLRYEKDGARDEGNMGKVDVIDATAEYIGIKQEDFSRLDLAVCDAMETVLGRGKVKNDDEINGYAARLEGQILGRLAAANKRYKNNPEAVRAYKNYIFYKLDNLPKEVTQVFQVANYILPPSLWENQVMAYEAQQPSY